MIYITCMVAAVLVLLAMAFQRPPQSDSYTSTHPASTVPPMMGFAADSVFNVGSTEELDAFPGVGEVISQRIVEGRAILGDYRIPEDLLMVKGIGEKTLERILDALEEPLIPLHKMSD